jgi:predicted nucleotide-binding protein
MPPEVGQTKAEFTKSSLEDAVAVPQALQKNGGQPLPAIDMATAIGRSPGSSIFRTITASANAYGLIKGTYKSTFAMRDLGEAITQPKGPDEAAHALVTAALTPATFRSIFDYYKGKKFPEKQFFVNTVIREFGVDAKQAETCVDIFEKNMRYVGLIRITPGGDWLSAEATPQGGTTLVQQQEVEQAEHEAEEVEQGVDLEALEELGRTPPATPEAPVEPARKKRPNRIFIGHGRNHKPLDQLTKTLDTMGIPYAVAEDEPNAGRPISKKVRDTMDQCGAAILIFSADVEYFDKDGEPVWRPSENVSHELGAASVMYDDRIILFKEDSVTLASNYSGIGYITFEKDKLDAKTNDLLRELVAFKILKLSLSDD